MDEAEDQYNVDLVRRIAQGDQVAFALFYDRFSPVLYGMAFRMMNNRGDAEDVLQESMAYIWRKAHAFDSSRRSAFAWVTMIVRNKAIDKLRARRRGERLQERVKGSSDLSSDRDDTSALEPLFREQRGRVRSALSQISPDQREALELSYFSGLTHEEIAAQLGTPLGTVKARIRRGVLRLRQLFQREV
ncbi:MAG: sigma-70 family RNA polymerase sigma factor [Verrucomicrobia bacterium]|nr:sigma-70 family RNA polymerase sigma factor [Verrucomicrobiota bacterium]